MKLRLTLLLCALMTTLTFQSCDITTTPAVPQQSSSGAKTVDISTQYTIPKNAQGNTVEQQQCLDKIKVTNDPSKIMWMHLIDLNGRIYSRTPVRSKITSSGKRLEPTVCAAGMSNGQGSNDYYGVRLPNGQFTNELIQPDGTYGTSDPYVYWFDPRGYYFQKGEGYLLSDMPIDLVNPKDAIGLYNLDVAAAAWQKAHTK